MTSQDGWLLSSDGQRLTLIAGFISALSFCGSGFACICYIALRHKRTFGLQLVFLLSLNDVLSHVWFFAQALRVWVGSLSESEALCMVQSYAAAYFLPSTFLWSSAIAYTLFATVVRGHQLEHSSRRLPYMVAVCQGVPLIFCIVIQFATMYIPAWVCIAFNLYVYVTARARLRALLSASFHWVEPAPPRLPAPESVASLKGRSSSWISQSDFQYDTSTAIPTSEAADDSYVELTDAPVGSAQASSRIAGPDVDDSVPPRPQSIGDRRDKLHKLYRRLMMYPLIQVVCWVWGSVNRVYGLFHNGESVSILSFLHIVFIAVQGLLNSITYGLTTGIGSEISIRVRRRLRRYLSGR